MTGRWLTGYPEGQGLCVLLPAGLSIRPRALRRVLSSDPSSLPGGQVQEVKTRMHCGALPGKLHMAGASNRFSE